MTRKIVLYISLVWSFTILNTVYSQVPQLLNYQGKLTDSNGQLLNGTNFITFYIYNQAAGGTALWTELQQVEVENGIYNVLLGGTNAINLDFSVQYWRPMSHGN